MTDEQKQYIVDKYGEETLKGIEDGTIYINDRKLNEHKRTFVVNIDDNKTNEQIILRQLMIDKWKNIPPIELV